MAFAAPRVAPFAAPWAARLRPARGGWRYGLPLALLLAGALCFQLTGNGEDAALPSGAAPRSADGTVALGAPSQLSLDPGSLVGALLVIAGLLAALPIVAKRVGAVAGGRGSIEVVEARPLGGRRALLLVRVEGRKVLIGSAEAGLSLLCQLDGSPRQSPTAGATADFEGALADELSVAPRVASAGGA